MNSRSRAFSFLLSCGVSAVHAAAPAGQFSCRSLQGYLQSEAPDLQTNPSGLLQGGVINLSYFDLGAGRSGSTNSGTGSGSGKLVYQPIVLRAAPATFLDFYSALLAGGSFSQCSVLTNLSNSSAIEFDLNLVTLEKVDVIATSATSQSPRSVYVEATLSFAAIEIRVGQTDSADAGANAATDEN